MQNAIKYLYHYLNYKPQIDILSAVTSYLIAVKGLLLTDETLKLIAAISSCAGCVVGCATALSWVARSVIWGIKMYKKIKQKTYDQNS